MKYFIDAALCCGHAQCEVVAPELFKTDDDGMNIALGDEVEIEPGKEDDARAGSEACPEAAIQVYH